MQTNSKTTYQNRHYLIVRPLYEDPADLEPHVESLQEITGLDLLTIRDKFTGPGLQILKLHQDPSRLEDMSRDLERQEGVLSAVVGRQELSGFSEPLHASGVKVDGKSIKFCSGDGGVLLSLEAGQRCLVVLGTMEYKRLREKLMARRYLNSEKPFSIKEMLLHILHHRPVMDIYTEGFDKPVRVESSNFNFKSLGEDMKKSTALHFSFILKSIYQSSTAVLDTGFGQTPFPFFKPTHGSKYEATLENFTAYSHFVYLACKKGLFKTARKCAFPEVPVLKELGGIFWGGPLLVSKPGARRSVAKKPPPPPPPLQPPPKSSVVFRADMPSTWGNFLKQLLWTYRRYVRVLGPPVLLYPLTAAAMGSAALAYFIKRPEPLSIGALAAGLILFIHAFVLLRRKRILENTPASKIRTMPMGEVEVNGYAKEKYFMKSPYTFKNCVYYSYKIYQRMKTGKGTKWTLKEWGTSGRMPFYLEDDTGRVVIIPEGGLLRTSNTQRVTATPVNLFASSILPSSNTTIVESVIASGDFLFVKGYARRLHMSSQEKTKEFVERLRELKRDRHRLKKYDLDGDGRISSEEWDLARKDIEEQALTESLSNENKGDDIAIGEHPAGGLFYISDRKEKKILRSMAWRIPLSFILGVAGIIASTVYILHDATNLVILWETFFR